MGVVRCYGGVMVDRTSFPVPYGKFAVLYDTDTSALLYWVFYSKIFGVPYGEFFQYHMELVPVLVPVPYYTVFLTVKCSVTLLYRY